ncbi:MAG: HD domain-containing protein [Fibromonadales bacterium]|nr:HD domain-containing protein [Fibromonadales bacterium]
MEKVRVLLMSKVPEKWEYFEKNLSDLYEFIHSKPSGNINLFNITLVATDEIDTVKEIFKKGWPPVVFFGERDDFSTEIKVRKLGASEYFSVPFDKNLLLFRLKNVVDMSRFVVWTRMIRREMVNLQEDMALTMAQTVESRDENTGGHIMRTQMFIGTLGEEFVNSGTITRDQLNFIVRAAPLHDIGKIGVPDSILLKPGPLNSEERDIMKAHVEKGAGLINKMRKKFESHAYLPYAYDIALYHHEWFDGSSGYPRQKKGTDIPFWARLMAVVDVFDALVSDRVYRKGMPRDVALDIIFEGEGTQFDPEVLKAFDDCKDFMIG